MIRKTANSRTGIAILGKRGTAATDGLTALTKLSKTVLVRSGIHRPPEDKQHVLQTPSHHREINAPINRKVTCPASAAWRAKKANQRPGPADLQRAIVAVRP
ncbi:MAG: hypothetical protein VXY12_05405, partial [Pseudomonadota bacterium]|nr:hypothetical protein [Pseudomonadota bacterium]